MASISTDDRGNRRILFKDKDGNRKCVRIGKPPMRNAEEICRRIEALNACKIMNSSPDADLARWVRDISDDMADKLAAVGLTDKRKKANAIPTLAEYIPIHIASRPGIKKSTRRTFEVALKTAVASLGPDKRLDQITERDAATMMTKLVEEEGYSKAYASKCLRNMKAMYRTAAREKLVSESPFAFLKAGSQSNRERTVFIPGEWVHRLIDALPDYEWKLTVALARWGGLRTPSEPFALKWEHVLWDQNKIIIPCPKLEHLDGRDTRVIPIFPELKPFIDAAWDAAEPGATYLVPRLRELSGNVRTQLGKYIDRAGIEWPVGWKWTKKILDKDNNVKRIVHYWPRMWQQLRASRATELADHFPGHVCSAWMGHTEEIADKHYNSVIDEHFERATANPLKAARIQAQQPHATACNGMNDKKGGKGEASKSSEICISLHALASGCTTEHGIIVGPPGFEGPLSSPNKTSTFDASGSEGGAHSGARASDTRLQAILTAWPELPEHVKQSLYESVCEDAR